MTTINLAKTSKSNWFYIDAIKTGLLKRINLRH